MRLAVAGGLSGVVGFEREAAHKAAGLRTNVLVGLGAALFTLVSIDGFPGADPARIAAQVVVGVGFLGAGAIFRHGATVEGLTTAASLWSVAAIGVAAGSGEVAGAGLATGLALLVLHGLRLTEGFMRRRSARHGILLEVRMGDLSAVAKILQMVDRMPPGTEVVRVEPHRGEGGRVCLRVRGDAAERTSGLLLSVDGVTGVTRVDR
jgi:putative Mg2+ transporter-C (MgtC) family protein